MVMRNRGEPVDTSPQQHMGVQRNEGWQKDNVLDTITRKTTQTSKEWTGKPVSRKGREKEGTSGPKGCAKTT